MTDQAAYNKPVIPNPNTGEIPEKRQLSEAEAQALLAVNSLQSQPVKSHSKLRLYIIMGLIVVIVIALFAATDQATKKTSSNNSPLPSKNNPLNNGGSINQQVQYCSNPVNASLVC